MTDDSIISNPIFPCICGHAVTTHGTEQETYRDHHYDWDDDHKEEIYIEDEYVEPVAFCYECEHPCYFIEMTNLEYLEWKSNGNDKR
jgi:hypothetical protein